MPDVFLTSTFRNDWNRAFNLRIGEVLKEMGLSSFLPQKDSNQTANRKTIYEEDIKGLTSCRGLLAVGALTQTANWGFEIGYATAKGMPVVVLTDKDHPIELMCEGAAFEVISVDNLDRIEAYKDRLESVLLATFNHPQRILS